MQSTAITSPNFCPRFVSRTLSSSALPSHAIRWSYSFSAILRMRSALPFKTASYSPYIEGGGSGPENAAASTTEVRTFSGRCSRISGEGRLAVGTAGGFDESCRLGCGGFVAAGFLAIPFQSAIHIGAYPLLVEKLRIARISRGVESRINRTQRAQALQHALQEAGTCTGTDFVKFHRAHVKPNLSPKPHGTQSVPPLDSSGDVRCQSHSVVPTIHAGYHVSMQGRFLPGRGAGGGAERSAAMIQSREAAGSITSSISK